MGNARLGTSVHGASRGCSRSWAETRHLEIELQHLVFDLHGLTPEEVQLLRSTAPPHDPLALVEAGGPAGNAPSS